MASKHFQEDLTERILTMLPVESLVRFKLLNKAYCALISSNRFIAIHFSYNTAKKQPSLLAFHSGDNFSITLVSDDKLSQAPIHLTPPSPYADHLVDEIVAYGPCNGILCLKVSHIGNPDRLMLWNPATREVKALPLSYAVNIFPEEYIVEVNGFGIDPITSDYKVVNIVAGVESDPNTGIRPTAQAYSLGTNSWNIVDIDVLAYDINDSPFTSYLNGVYHWLIKVENRHKSILCFNMSNNVFWKMNLPPISQDGTNERLEDSDFAIIKDCVAYIKEYSSAFQTRVEIWVMNEYGVEESWTKRFNIVPHLVQWKFWGLWKDDEALITKKDYELPLVCYNLNAQQLVEIVPNDEGVMLHAFRYVESVVPLLVEEEE